jgi:hypothetical protein
VTLKKARQPRDAFIDGFDPNTRGALGRSPKGKPKVSAAASVAAESQSLLGSALKPLPEVGSPARHPTAGAGGSSKSGRKKTKRRVRCRDGAVSEHSEDSSELDEPGAFEEVEEMEQDGRDEPRLAAHGSSLKAVPKSQRAASRGRPVTSLLIRRICSRSDSVWQLVRPLPSDDNLYADEDFAQPGQNKDAPTKRKAKSAVDKAKSRGRLALPDWALDVVDAVLASLFRLYAGLADPWMLDKPEDPQNPGDMTYTFHANFLVVVQRLAPTRYDEVVREGRSHKLYKYDSIFFYVFMPDDADLLILQARNSMHTWWSQFQRHADAFVRRRMRQPGTRKLRTKADISKIVEKALDRESGEAMWDYHPTTGVRPALLVRVFALTVHV